MMGLKLPWRSARSNSSKFTAPEAFKSRLLVWNMHSLKNCARRRPYATGIWIGCERCEQRAASTNICRDFWNWIWVETWSAQTAAQLILLTESLIQVDCCWLARMEVHLPFPRGAMIPRLLPLTHHASLCYYILWIRPFKKKWLLRWRMDRKCGPGEMRGTQWVVKLTLINFVHPIERW